ncbi:putative ATP-dependent RNA helicase DHR1 [Tieghemiomyces parasiticus]|uniref:RNA helicase n=1 Tax=Tieghemiomyces parasiticus TaxID=78921 RepID=A0A9W8A6L0_9FUNG|nr:putative ATP-dependent RNA helicase DHR1 [Tieghemiomyces parasiticus]
MPKIRPRYNDKARRTERGHQPAAAEEPGSETVDQSNAVVMPSNRHERLAKAAADAGVILPGNKLSIKKQRRLEKYIEKKLKKEERVTLIEKLATSSFGSAHLRSSRSLGYGLGKETLRERLRRAAMETRDGLPRSDPSVPLLVERHIPDIPDFVTTGQSADIMPMTTAEARTTAASAPVPTVTFGGALKRSAEGAAPVPIVKRQRKKTTPSYIGLIKAQHTTNDRLRARAAEQAEADDADTDFDSSDSAYDSSEDDSEGEEEGSGKSAPVMTSVTVPAPTPTSAQPTARPVAPVTPTGPRHGKVTIGPHQPAPSSVPAADRRQTFFVTVERTPEIEASRAKLPICAEEQSIMETILANPVVVLCGETGSGKTTQVPQFLYEAGFGNPDSDNPGMIGVTQPRRVAAISMAKRVGEELNLTGTAKVAHQIRYDSTARAETAIKFMTDGVLLRELAQDLLLSRYSVLIVDEAHERSLNTDILIGVVSRVVKLRAKLHRENPTGEVRPLRVIIMSATLRVEDFTGNKRLFPSPPPVIRVDARQYPVKMHFNRVTHADYVGEALKKVSKIHTRLPRGGILVFLTSQNEITTLCRTLRRKYAHGSAANVRTAAEEARPSSLTAEEDPGRVGQADLRAEEFDLGDQPPTVDGELRDDYVSDDDDKDREATDADEETDDEGEPFDGRWPGDEEEVENEDDRPDPAAQPLYVLPLYSLLPTAQQMRVFEPVPEGHRLCVVATNVAETSLTIPGIRYVVDGGKVKERKYDGATGTQSFEVNWVSQAAGNQRAGRAGRTGPGHCYRLYSSAVFNDHFKTFSEPEILQMAIEGVVLQMKAMLLDNVVNFPFPTMPDRADLLHAEKLLVHLEALDPESKRITEAGKLMAEFPVAPRFSRMLLVGQQHQCLDYVVAIAAGMSVGDPFVHEANLYDVTTDRPGGQAGSEEGDSAEVTARRKAERTQYKKAMAELTGPNPTSDMLKLLHAVCAYEFAGGSEDFCRRYYLRPKAMREIQQLRVQLTRLYTKLLPSAKLGYKTARLDPPTPFQTKVLRQTIVAGFIDRIAVRWDLVHSQPPPGHHSKSKSHRLGSGSGRDTPYVTMVSHEPVYVHGSSVLADQPAPETIAYQELQRSVSHDPNAALDPTLTARQRYELKNAGRLWLKGLTNVHPRWLTVLGRHLTTLPKPLMHPAPRYYYATDVATLDQAALLALHEGKVTTLTPESADDKDTMFAYVDPTFGPKSWPLPRILVQYKREGSRWVMLKVVS